MWVQGHDVTWEAEQHWRSVIVVLSCETGSAKCRRVWVQSTCCDSVWTSQWDSCGILCCVLLNEDLGANVEPVISCCSVNQCGSFPVLWGGWSAPRSVWITDRLWYKLWLWKIHGKDKLPLVFCDEMRGQEKDLCYFLSHFCYILLCAVLQMWKIILSQTASVWWWWLVLCQDALSVVWGECQMFGGGGRGVTRKTQWRLEEWIFEFWLGNWYILPFATIRHFFFYI